MPQGKHRCGSEAPCRSPGESEGRLGEVCAVSLSPLFMADPLSHTCTQALFSQSPLGCQPSPGPRGWRRSCPLLSPSQITRVSPSITGPVGIQGLRETKLDGSPGRQEEDPWRSVRPESCESGSRGRRESAIWSPGEPLSPMQGSLSVSARIY